MSLEIKNLNKTYKKNGVKAVSSVSFSLDQGKTLGIIGASGCGKSTLLKLILRLEPLDSGEIYFENSRVDRLPQRKLKDFRRKVQMVFQEPYQSLDPRMKIAAVLREPFLISGEKRKEFIDEKIKGLLEAVGLPEHFLQRFPHEISGGECQRVAIARAISLEPRLLLCDEAVSSLDAVNKIQILNLLLKFQKEKGISLIFVSHDERAVRHMSDEVRLMRDGVLSLS